MREFYRKESNSMTQSMYLEEMVRIVFRNIQPKIKNGKITLSAIINLSL
jgi:hypothetical protein